MSDTKEFTYTDFVIPASIISKTDIARLVSDAETLDNALTAAAVHEKIHIEQQVENNASPNLSDFLSANDLAMDDSTVRSKIIHELRRLKDNVPIIHMTFAVEADHESLEQLSSWLRESIHPQAVIAVGLQPSLVAGVYVRTANKVFDRSLRERLKQNRHVLMDELEALHRG